MIVEKKAVLVILFCENCLFRITYYVYNMYIGDLNKSCSGLSNHIDISRDVELTVLKRLNILGKEK